MGWREESSGGRWNLRYKTGVSAKRPEVTSLEARCDTPRCTAPKRSDKGSDLVPGVTGGTGGASVYDSDEVRVTCWRS